MNKTVRFIVGAAAFAIMAIGASGCTQIPQETTTSSGHESVIPTANASNAEYLTYSDSLYEELLGNEAFALFFHADWCPTCRGMEKNIKSDIENFPEDAKIVKVNYDTATELKKELGVTMQSTIVIFDAEGNVIDKLAAPNNNQIKDSLESVL